MSSAPQQLVDWLTKATGMSVHLAEPPRSNGDGFDSEVYFVRLEGDGLDEAWRRPLVLRIKPGADQLEVARHEADIQDWAADRGYPTPRVLEVLVPGAPFERPAQVMERAPGRIALDAATRRPWKARAIIDRLAGLQVDLHQLPADGFPDSEDLFDRRLSLARSVVAGMDGSDGPRRLDAVEALADRCRDAPGAVCHGDFHPLNVLVDGPQMSVIDWTDAGVGDRHGDVARTLLLFELAAIAASNPVQRVVLTRLGPALGRRYRASYEARLGLDASRLALWRPVHLLHGWAQVVGLHEGAFGDGTPDGTVERVPVELADRLGAMLDAALAEL